jgi:hypothetical protein
LYCNLKQVSKRNYDVADISTFGKALVCYSLPRAIPRNEKGNGQAWGKVVLAWQGW